MVQSQVASAASLGSLLETQNLRLCSHFPNQNLNVDRISGDWSRISDPRGNCTGQWFLMLRLAPGSFRKYCCLASASRRLGSAAKREGRGNLFKISHVVLTLPKLKLKCQTGWKIQEKKVTELPSGCCILVSGRSEQGSLQIASNPEWSRLFT